MKSEKMSQTKIYDSARHIYPALEELRNLFEYRFLILQLIQRDILTRYKRSILGIAWTMLNPLGTMLVLSIVFSQLFAVRTPAYPFYLLSGLMAWNFFAQSTTAAMQIIVWGSGLLHKIYVPRSIFTLSAICTAMVNLVLAIVPLLLVSLILKFPLGWAVLFLPVPMLLLAFFAFGIGLLLSTLAVYFPDVSEMYQIVLMAWMYMTPVIYPANIIPVNIQTFIRMNPMYYLLNLYRLPLYDGRLPAWGEIWPAAVWAVGMMIFGWFVFTSKSDEFAYRV
jgi:ABC-type polysaccharide/polyol phosphate export permease